MAILGSLSEFPLPEVLLLIGTRTGRLRLLDVPEFGMMDIDFSNGEVQAMQLGTRTLTESADMIGKLGGVVQMQAGMFEFRLQPVASIARPKPLFVNQLVMSLVCHVDHEIALEKAHASSVGRYVLTVPQPQIWIEPELHVFFAEARPYFSSLGVQLADLARFMGMDIEIVRKHLANMRLLGLVQLKDEADIQSNVSEMPVQDEISLKSNEFLRASRSSSELKKITGRLPQVKIS
jgi:hypothetical protein